MKTSNLFLNLFLLLFFIIPLQAQITGTFTADNCYAVYKGSSGDVQTKLMPQTGNGHCNKKASEIFSPNQRTFNLAVTDYLYIIAWSDDRTCQGLLGEFTGQRTIKTGQPGWQVYATNKNYGNGQSPSVAEINGHINTANNNSAWETPFVGGRNDSPKSTCRAYAKVNGISDDAKWIWYNAKKGANTALDVMGSGFNHKEFLIFRFPVKRIGTTGNGDDTSTTPTFEACCPPLVKDDLASSLQVSGNINSYKPKLVMGRDLKARLQAYANYAMALDPCLKHVTLEYVIRETDGGPTNFSLAPNTILSRGATVFNKRGNSITNWGQADLSNISLDGNKWYRLDMIMYGGPDNCAKWNFAKDCKDGGRVILDFNLNSNKIRTGGNFNSSLKELNAQVR